MTEAHPTPAPKVVHASGQIVPEHLSTTNPAATKEEKIDQQMADSFPASDPVERESDAATGSHEHVAAAEKKVLSGDAKKPQTY
jgi:hypothetical protein